MSERARDHYEVLGVDRSATADEIKAAFRRKAAAHHPDRNPENPDAAVRFKEINAAYQVLSDPQRRSVYDRFGHRAEEAGSPFASGGPFAGGVVDLGDIAIDGILGDLLGVFGVGRGDKGDIALEVEVTFEEAAFGCEKRVEYTKLVTCASCSGDGSAPGTKPIACPACAGRGRVRFQQGFIPIAVEKTCARCKGMGRIVVEPCGRCLGRGLASVPAFVTVSLPGGVEDGATKLVDGAGNRTRIDRPPGDAELTVKVRPHPFFKRVGDDVVCAVPITFVQAAIGGEVEVPTLDGKSRVRVPAGTQPGNVLRLKGKGFPSRLGPRGDQRIEVVLEVPTALSPRARELLEELGRELGEEVQPQRKTFGERLRDLFG